ncbi:MAG: alpha-mannosidase, partial [Anaerolineae bacterium]
MPEYKFYTKRQLVVALKAIGDAVYTPVAPLTIEAWRTHEPVPYAARTSGTHLSLKIGDKWGDLFDSAWFHFTGRVPQKAAGQKIVLLLDVSGEMAVFDEHGVPKRGLTPVSSTFDYSLGEPGKRVLQFAAEAKGGEEVDIWADAGCNDLFGNLKNEGRVRQASVAKCDEAVRALYYDFEVLLDLLNVLDEDSPRYHQILTGLTDVTHLLYQGIADVAEEAREILAPLLAQKGGDPSLQISAVGHAHMDLAWLWPVRETIRKGARTFSTAIELMDRYPDYVTGASQPQYYLWMKEHYPELYAKIKTKVAEGRIEPQGAMWVEADTNISGGEALVRQVLYGKRFFRDEFGVEIDYLWLPDVFGYSAALPQILKKAGVDYFSTQKLSWSLINTFPHHSFAWQGIDGTQILTHMLPEETYNSPAAPRSVRKIERNYKDKGVSHHGLMVFGIGDGGGGPGEAHLERLDRLQNLAGLSPVSQESVAAFFKKWRTEADRFPTWVGELYLERHEGTLTTEARNKRYNRKLELGLRDLEFVATAAGLLADHAYPAERLLAIWREVLLYQFHDILPGSSIKRVYDESLTRYEAMEAQVAEATAAANRALATQVNTADLEQPVIVQNTLSWPRTAWMEIAGSWRHVTVPPMGYTTLDAAAPAAEMPDGLTATTDTLENDYVRVSFGEDGAITSILDKVTGREVVPEGAKANELVLFADLGDAWDFPMDYAEQTPRHLILTATEPRMEGPRAILGHTYRLGESEVRQDVVLTAGSARLDFETHAHWREPRAMLRTRFPVAVHAEEATYEIQFGHIRRPTHRNTTWDLARDEVAAHRWVDLAQQDYGVALLNDCKYGHKIKGNVIDLNLLRSVPYPGAKVFDDTDLLPGEPNHLYTDQCDHDFTYALYPHAGNAGCGGVIQEAYALNVPLRVIETDAHTGPAPREHALIEVGSPDIVIEAVKKAEDSDDIILRLYEAAGGQA